ncbi:xanthine phosphoribosyltransferase [Clostridia bacterium]|nr:xanthine phosphoribosyltransferase [Clostridia bacterium]
MEELKKKIVDEGEVIGTEILKVDCFLNHQLDVAFLDKVAKEFYERYKDHKIDKILTVEVSGIAIAVLTARYFDVPVLFAKKLQSKTLNEDMYEAHVHSFTKKIDYNIRVSKKYLHEGDHVLLIDDFLAKGQAAMGLAEICDQAGAIVEGIGIVIEKDFQEGGVLLRERGYKVDSLARIIGMNEEEIVFGEE